MTSPKIKVTFLGSGSAFTVGESNYHSNLLIEDLQSSKKLLIDCGSDARLSMFEQQLSFKDIDAVYISHVHADHTGGLEWLGFSRYFSPLGPVTLFIADDVEKPLWTTLKAGMSTLPEQQAQLNTFFKVSIAQNKQFSWQGHTFVLEPTQHVVNNGLPQPCYGLKFQVNGSYVYFTSDSILMYDQKKALFEKATTIFHDCETASPSGVHANYSQLVQLPANIRGKIWLYHYNAGDKPNSIADGFQGLVQKGQTFYF